MVLNFTPHDITLFTDNGGTVVFPAESQPARVKEVWMDRAWGMSINPDGEGDNFDVPVGWRLLGEIEGLPHPQPGTYLICSSIVAQKAWKNGRGDVIVPADFVRDDAGRIVGCRRFEVIPD